MDHWLDEIVDDATNDIARQALDFLGKTNPRYREAVESRDKENPLYESANMLLVVWLIEQGYIDLNNLPKKPPKFD